MDKGMKLKALQVGRMLIVLKNDVKKKKIYMYIFIENGQKGERG